MGMVSHATRATKSAIGTSLTPFIVKVGLCRLWVLFGKKAQGFLHWESAADGYIRYFFSIMLAFLIRCIPVSLGTHGKYFSSTDRTAKQAERQIPDM